MNSEIIPKSTLFRGYKFRSKLEAKWAVFFDSLNIAFEYEPEAFVCDDGSQYTPDFFLPNCTLRYGLKRGVYLEIKRIGWADTLEEQFLYTDRISSSFKTGLPLLLFTGDPFDSVTDECKEDNLELSPSWDNYMMMFLCDACGHLKFEFSEGNYMECPMCDTGNRDHNRLVFAAQIARSYKFKFIKTF